MLSYIDDKKEVKTLIDLMRKQYLSVGSALQSHLKKEYESKGETFIPKPYMDGQRGYAWETWRASNLLQSILLFDGAIPSFTAYRNDTNSNHRKILDGQQRLTSLYLIISDALTFDMSKTMFPVFAVDGVDYQSATDLHGKRFSELPKEWQEIILNRSLDFKCINGCTDETAEKIFVQYNISPKVLKPTEVRRAGMGCKVRFAFTEARQSDWILHAMTETARDKNQGDEIFAQMVALLDSNLEAVSLASASVDSTIYKYRDSGLPETMLNDINEINAFLNDVTAAWIENKKTENKTRTKGRKPTNYNTYRFQFLNKTNTVMLMAAAHMAIQRNANTEQFAEWAYDYFSNPPTGYQKACGSGSAEKPSDESNVALRLAMLRAAVNTLDCEAQEEITPEAVEDHYEEIVNGENDFADFDGFEDEEYKEDVKGGDSKLAA